MKMLRWSSGVAWGLSGRSPGIESRSRQVGFFTIIFHFFFPISCFLCNKILIILKGNRKHFFPYFMHVINKNSRYHTTFDGEMNFAVLPFQLRYCNLATSIVDVVCTSPWVLPNWFAHKGPPWGGLTESVWRTLYVNTAFLQCVASGYCDVRAGI